MSESPDRVGTPAQIVARRHRPSRPDRARRLLIGLCGGLKIRETRRLLIVTDRTLRTHGLSMARSRLDIEIGPLRRGGTPVADPIELVLARVAVASRTVRRRPTCLRRALVTEALLSEIGVESATRIGIARATEEGKGAVWASHAWVETDGTPITDRPDSIARYRPVRHPALIASVSG